MTKSAFGDFFKSILKNLEVEKVNVDELSPLVYAYIGDTVYEVFIRTMAIMKGNLSVAKLHQLSVEYVKAKAQSEIIHGIMGHLTEEEISIVKRGRNAKSGTVPKHADVMDYKYATGFETLIGYLYLKGNFDRLIEVIKLSLEFKNNV